LIELILEEWLTKPQEEKAIALAAVELRKAQKKEHSQKRRGRKPKASSDSKEPEAKGTAAVQYQLEQYRKQHPEWRDEEAQEKKRPTNQERREQEVEAGAKKILQKPEKQYTLRFAWSPCSGEEFVATRSGLAGH
jgi:hypothetical protein